MSMLNIEKSRSIRLELRLPRQVRSDWPRDALVLAPSTLPQPCLERENKSPVASLIIHSRKRNILTTPTNKMTDYAKKTVADLTEILKSRGLPHTGKKADVSPAPAQLALTITNSSHQLVARLTEADKAAETTSASAPPTASPPAQQPAAEVPPPSATSTAVPTAPAPPAPATTTHQIDTTEESSAAAAGATTAPTDAPTPDTALAAATYKLDLPTSSVDDELKKRQARAARFGTTAAATSEGDNDKDIEAQRALERAKRFGTGETAMGKLDEALPMTREKKGERKRGADDSGLKGRGGGGGKRSRGGGQGGGRGERPHAAGRQNSAAPRGEKPVGVVKVQPAFVSEKDRAAAEARKKKFGA